MSLSLISNPNPNLFTVNKLTLKNPNPKNPSLKLKLKPTQCCKLQSQSLNFVTPHLLPHWRPVLTGWASSAVSAVSLSLIVPRLASISSLVANGTVPINQAVALCALALARAVSGYWQEAMLWEAALSTVYGIRVYVFDRVLERDLGFWERGEGAGDVAYRITAEGADVGHTIYALLNTTVPSILQLSAMATRMLAISPVLSVVTALVIPLVAYVTICLGQELRKISKNASIRIAALSAYLNEVLPSVLFVKANSAEHSEGARFRRLALADLSGQYGKKKMKALIPEVVQMSYFGGLLSFCVGSMVFLGDAFDCCGMVSFLTSLVFLIEPIQAMGKAYNEYKQGEPAIERLFNLTRFQSQVIEKSDAINLEHVKGEVRFCETSFRYADEMPLVLNGLNLHIKAGETIALVGPSGGGKTTLVKLLLRLYEPLQGCILIDNHDVKTIRLKSLRRHVGLVSQDTTLFSGTVAENIGYRDLTTKIDMVMVRLAAQTANADEFIKLLPEQYDTNIGPRGSTLSGGQKQRLAIARAVYQNPSILVLDEATSALDSRSELLVRQAVERLTENRTVLVIAHRLETVLMANRIFLLDNGSLRELNRSALLDGQQESLASSGDMDTSNPAVFVNAELLRMYVGRKVRAVIQVIRSDAGSVIGKSTDEQQLVVKGSPPFPLSTYVEVIGIADTNQSIRAEIWNNFGDTFDMQNYNQLCVLANGEYKNLFI